MVSTIICEVITIMWDIGTINMRFYLLEVQYLLGYYKITLENIININKIHCITITKN